MKIHFVGSEGVSMKALANISKSYGHTVSGSDITKGGHSESHVLDADLVVYTSAVGADNVEVAAAKRQGVRTIERAEYLGEISKKYKNVLAVAGTHGKTTASGFLANALSCLSPTLHIGGSMQDDTGLGGENKFSSGGFDYFITEACEYKRSFLSLSPQVGIILNIELDHTDYYRDYADYLSAFQEFAFRCNTVILNGDDEGCKQIKSNNRVTFGLGEGNDYRAVNIQTNGTGRSFDVLRSGMFLASVHIQPSGNHNVYNALAAIAASDYIGANLQHIVDGVSSFKGMRRRFEFIADIDGTLFYTDYAHHPSELKTTALCAREITQKKVTIIFEPHTYSRTKSLAAEFAHALSLADDIILTPIFPARETPIEGVTSHTLIKELQKLGKTPLYFNTFPEVFSHLNSHKNPGEIIILTGAGDGILKAVQHLRNSLAT